jgi:hypothetical protein
LYTGLASTETPDTHCSRDIAEAVVGKSQPRQEAGPRDELDSVKQSHLEILHGQILQQEISGVPKAQEVGVKGYALLRDQAMVLTGS